MPPSPKSKRVVLLQTKPGSGRLTFHGARSDAGVKCRLGHEYYLASTKTRPPVSLYLLGHALELFFKAYLRAGEPNLPLKEGFRHNLDRLLRACIAAGLRDEGREIAEALIRDIEAFNPFYKDKRFEYVGFADLYGHPWATLPDMRRIQRLARTLDKTMMDRLLEHNAAELTKARQKL